MGCLKESLNASKREQVAENGNRVLKFLCSYGGNIMPRPGDGSLRYVGGKTRVVVVNGDIRFAELMNKLEDLSFSSAKLKYQLPSQDLDVLVSVTCDEDVQYMIEEYEKYENIARNDSTPFFPKIRAFLFPANPPLLSPEEPRSPTQKYIDMVNGCLLLSPRHPQRCSIKTNSDYCAFSDGSDSPASIRVSLVSSPSASPRFSHGPATRVDYRHPLSDNVHQIQNHMKRVTSERTMANPCSPRKMSSSGQYQLQTEQSRHLQRVRSSPNLEQYPQHYSAHVSSCNSHDRAAVHAVRQEESSSHSQNMFAASTRTASPLQHVYSFETFDN